MNSLDVGEEVIVMPTSSIYDESRGGSSMLQSESASAHDKVLGSNFAISKANSGAKKLTFIVSYFVLIVSSLVVTPIMRVASFSAKEKLSVFMTNYAFD